MEYQNIKGGNNPALILNETVAAGTTAIGVDSHMTLSCEKRARSTLSRNSTPCTDCPTKDTG